MLIQDFYVEDNFLLEHMLNSMWPVACGPHDSYVMGFQGTKMGI